MGLGAEQRLGQEKPVHALAGLISRGFLPHSSYSNTISSPVWSTDVFVCLLDASTYTSSLDLRRFLFFILHTKESIRPLTTSSIFSVSIPS